jgi:hypothetical protein
LCALCEERLSIEATARLLNVAKKTIYKTLKKEPLPLEEGLIWLKRDAVEWRWTSCAFPRGATCGCGL